ncbi:hypothetical protein DFH27DRAFT_605798 [Peziza echinospora]|nr:hypothetical protein DFH27DRAFT_605798 [Peziza echinospora]
MPNPALEIPSGITLAPLPLPTSADGCSSIPFSGIQKIQGSVAAEWSLSTARAATRQTTPNIPPYPVQKRRSSVESLSISFEQRAQQMMQKEQRREMLMKQGSGVISQTNHCRIDKYMAQNHEFRSEVAKIPIETFVDNSLTGCTPKERFAMVDKVDDPAAWFLHIQDRADGCAASSVNEKLRFTEELLQRFENTFQGPKMPPKRERDYQLLPRPQQDVYDPPIQHSHDHVQDIPSMEMDISL